jgi:G3E family GTPase
MSLPSPLIPPNPLPTQARYVMIGGFLGAGKTTAVAQLAQRLSARGLRVGLITNDQGQELVDTAMLRSRGFATEEIPGGCFCCRFNSLVEAADRLSHANRPEVFIAEPVGSCTDLVATVTYPLRRIYGNQFKIAPLSVLLDPIRAQRILGLQPGPSFSPKVTYIYRKQLEEADLLVISKADLLDPPQLETLRAALQREYPQTEVLTVSARTGQGLEEWFQRIESSQPSRRPSMEIDYDLYAEGEALLGWLNATIALQSPIEFDANELLKTLALETQTRLRSAQAEIAHFKMTFSPDQGLGDIAVVNLVRNDFVPELSIRLEPPATSGQLIVNLRAEAAPNTLAQGLQDGLAALTPQFNGLHATLQHLEQFRPGRPTPTHRDASASLEPA